MTRRPIYTYYILVAALLLFISSASAYCIQGNDQCPQNGGGWPKASGTFYTQGYRGSASIFDQAFDSALTEWNDHSNFTYKRVASSANPCTNIHKHSWEFNSHLCGASFGKGTLAVTLTYSDNFSPSIGTILDSDIIFNSAYNWSVYSGSNRGSIDFKRVAVHESGHALGLGHSTHNTSIMAPTLGNIEAPQADDILGLIALYELDQKSISNPEPAPKTHPNITAILTLLLLN